MSGRQRAKCKHAGPELAGVVQSGHVGTRRDQNKPNTHGARQRPGEQNTDATPKGSSDPGGAGAGLAAKPAGGPQDYTALS